MTTEFNSHNNKIIEEFNSHIKKIILVIKTEKQKMKTAEKDIKTLIDTVTSMESLSVSADIIKMMRDTTENKKKEYTIHKNNIDGFSSEINKLRTILDKQNTDAITEANIVDDIADAEAKAIADKADAKEAQAKAEAIAHDAAIAQALANEGNTEVIVVDQNFPMLPESNPALPGPNPVLPKPKPVSSNPTRRPIPKRSDGVDDSEIRTDAEEAATKATKADEALRKVAKSNKAVPEIEQEWDEKEEEIMSFAKDPKDYIGNAWQTQNTRVKKSPEKPVEKPVLVSAPKPVSKLIADAKTKLEMHWYKTDKAANSSDDLGTNAAWLNSIIGEENFYFDDDYFEKSAVFASTFYLYPTCDKNIFVIVDDKNNSDVLQEEGKNHDFKKIAGKGLEYPMKNTFVPWLTTPAVKSVYEKLSGNRKKFVVVYKERVYGEEHKHKFNIMIHQWREQYK